MIRPVATIATERFTLRPLRRTDAAALFATLSDPIHCRYLTRGAFGTEGELWDWLSDPDWNGRTWIAEDRSGAVTGRLVAVPKHEDRVEEIGYVTCADRQGEGVAHECATALIAHLFASGARKLLADVDVENAGSIRLIERLGFVREGTLREHETTHEGLCDLHLYGLLASEYRAAV